MKDENSCYLSGRLTRDIEVAYTRENKVYIKFGLALHVDNEITYFLECVGYDRLADFAKDIFKKGDPVMIRGYLRQRKWIDETSKRRRDHHDIVIQRIQMLGTYGNRSKNSGGTNASTKQNGHAQEIDQSQVSER